MKIEIKIMTSEHVKRPALCAQLGKDVLIITILLTKEDLLLMKKGKTISLE